MPEITSQNAKAPYRAYLVRLWQEEPDLPWRAFTRDSETSEEQRFGTIEQLFLFLHRQTEGWSPRSERNETTSIAYQTGEQE